MGHRKKRHGALYRQLCNEYVKNGYTLKEAMEIVGDYLDLHERVDGLTCDEDFSRTLCYIRDSEDDDRW